MESATKTPLSACLTDEEVTALVEGIASPEERARCEHHIAECSACAILTAAVSAASTASGSRDRSPPELLSPGAHVGRYEILGCLGAGAMGTVYAAHDPALDRQVALKLIRAQVAGPELEVRLLREAKAMARLVHPGVITVHDAGRDGERLFIAMELVDGGTLRQWLLEKPRTWREIVEVYLRAGEGLAQAHASGLVHRDFKPDNVLIGKDGRVRVTDFGLARETEAGSDASEPPGLQSRRGPRSSGVALETTMNVALTRTGALVGTPVYMAPEQLAGIATDARSDLYSFCVALFEGLYGRRPYAGKTVTAQLREKQSDVFPPAERGVPARVRKVLAAGLRARPEDRPESMKGLLATLGRAARWPLVTPERPLLLVGASLVVLAAGVGVSWKSARHGAGAGASAESTVPGGASASVSKAVTVLAGPDARLACPIFETRGVSDVGVRLGAAAAMLVCARESWEIGGNDDRVLPPAALLGVPTQPTDGFDDPYAAPEQRARAVEIAKGRAAAYVDGLVTYERDTWGIDLVLRAPDDGEIARSHGSETTFLEAVREAANALWRSPVTPLVPLARRPIDDDVARWTSYRSADLGVLQTNINLFGAASECAGLGKHDTGPLLFYFWELCARFGVDMGSLEASAPALDESSPEAVVTSVRALNMGEIGLAADQARRVATGLEERRTGEPPGFGRARLALTAGLLWASASDAERARATLLLALRDDPLMVEAWEGVVRPEGLVPVPSAASVASAWFPAEASFLAKAGSWRGDEIQARLRDGRLAFILEPRFRQALHLGRTLAELGRASDARAIAAAPLMAGTSADEVRSLQAYVLAFVDLHEAKLARAIADLEAAGNPAMIDLVVVADVAGRQAEVSKRWAQRFLALSDDDAGRSARNYHAPMVLCMRAGPLAIPCLDRVERLGRAQQNWWYERGTALLEGARRYAAGDIRGAVSSWRPLVAGENLEIARELPTEAFEQAGEADLAARLDDRKMPYTFIAGVSDAAPREAARALKRGDRPRALDLARGVVRAWEVADLDVPAVPRMRALIGDAER